MPNTTNESDYGWIMSFVGEPEENGCRRWKGKYDRKDGQDTYGYLYAGGHKWGAHRWFAVHLLTGGMDPGDELEVRHMCHNPWCVAVEHLQWGSRKDNMQDSIANGTHVSLAWKWDKVMSKLERISDDQLGSEEAERLLEQLDRLNELRGKKTTPGTT